MNDVSSPPTETTSTETSPSYPAQVWEQIQLNLNEAYHCIETANHWAKNHPNLQRMMHEINALKKNQPIRKNHSKSTSPNQEFLAKLAKMEEKQMEFQNKWNPILAKITITATITTLPITTPITTSPISTAMSKPPSIKKTWAQTAALNSSEDFVYKVVKKKSFFKTIFKQLFKTFIWKKKKWLLHLIILKCTSISWKFKTKST